MMAFNVYTKIYRVAVATLSINKFDLIAFNMYRKIYRVDTKGCSSNA